jgi:hypothetical protein
VERAACTDKALVLYLVAWLAGSRLKDARRVTMARLAARHAASLIDSIDYDSLQGDTLQFALRLSVRTTS